MKTHTPRRDRSGGRMRAILGGVALWSGFLAVQPLEVPARERPNVIVILVDDMGYGDVAAHGNPAIRTPHLDRLHAQSARLTDFHVDPTCSPTRGALMTGKYAHRARVWHTIAAGNHLRAGEMTMADAFRANGYRTGMFGKWHLGANFPYRPIDRGFDEWLGQGDGGTGTTDDHFWNDRVNDHYLHNGEWKRIDGWTPEVFFNAAIQFARESGRARKPFFAYLCTYLPHTPVTLPDPAWADGYKGKVPDGTAFFFAAIERIDAQVGRLRAALAEAGLDRDTILIFLTDNGGTLGVKVFNAGMRGQKGDVYDGGHRVPCFIHWPAGRLRQGEDLPALNAHIDLLPTLVELCSLELPRAVDFDGRSIRPQLLDARAEVPDRTLFVERQRTFKPEKGQGAVGMTARWRLVDHAELYDIREDPGQTNNVIAAHPGVVARIREGFEAYWTKVSPGDRDRAVAIVGDERDPETFLHPSDWYLANPPWHHAAVAAGPPVVGDWMIRAARPGTYRFEVRRWPREADAPLDGVPAIGKTADAWDAAGRKPGLLYGFPNARFRALPVAAVRLTVDGKSRTRSAAVGTREVSFDLELEPSGAHEVKAELLDAAGATIAGGYYVYVRPVHGPSGAAATVYPDGRPAARLRLDAVDQGVILRHGDGPGECDRLGARDVWVHEHRGTYYMHYDGAGPRGWLACLATSTSLVDWIRHGPVLDLGQPGDMDAAGACYGVPHFDGRTWHLFYLGTPHATPAPERIPSFPYLTLKATGASPAGPWTKRRDVVPFRTRPGTYYAATASPGHVIRHGDEHVMFFSASTDRPVLRTLGIARTRDLEGAWTVDEAPIVPLAEQIENSSLYYEPANGTWFLFTNHVGVDGGTEYTDAVWVYWTKDLNHWNAADKAVVLDGRNCAWSRACIGLPSVLKAGDRLAVFYDAPGAGGTSHMRRDIGLAWLALPLVPPQETAATTERGSMR